MPLKHLLAEHKPALLIGNGINRYGSGAPKNSWNDLLISLARKHIDSQTTEIPPGVSLTEFYDSLELSLSKGQNHGVLQQDFCEPMHHWEPDQQHHGITQWAINNDSPILTTNFDTLLARAAKAKLHTLPGLRFTDFYPWNRYYGLSLIPRPDKGFGIWHINGTIQYKRSIRLGLTHYMGSVERARSWLHKGDEKSLFRSKEPKDWTGFSTWLHVIFSKPLLIMGLGLEENEVFLRWLLIERARYFKSHPEQRQPAWFAHVGKESPGKSYFLRSVGIEMLQVASYDTLYGKRTWG